MPAEQCLGLDEQLSEVSTVEELAEPGEQCPVRRTQRRARHLTTEHCYLMAKHDDLDGEFTVFIAKESE
ncbi:MAG: hypothetical protein ABSB99_10255 [Acidimicrobiales bacterium]|jgi:hypothetical protein